MPKAIAVFGATGHQGGAVAKALARDTENFKVCGIPNVQQEVQEDDLKNSGVKVMPCDLDDVNSIKTVLNDVDGCYIVTYTDFSEDDCIEKEIQRGKNIANACKQAGISQVIYSTQLDTKKIKGIEVRHLVTKSEIEEIMMSLNLPMTSFLVPCFYENFYDYLKPRRVQENKFVLEIPMGETPLDLISVEDIGEVAKIVFLNRESFLEKTLSLCGSKLTIKEIAAELSRQLHPMNFRDRPVTVNEYKGFGKPWSIDYGNMFEFFVRKDQRYHIEHTKDIYEAVQRFDQWVQKNKTNLADAIVNQ